MSTTKHRVVIIGGGFGGLFAAAAQACAGRRHLVDRTNHHLFQPLLYQVATGILSEGEVAPPLREVLRRHATSASSSAEVTGDRPRRPDGDARRALRRR